MSILRFAARSMLASFFITEGVKSITKPDELVPAAEKVTATALPLAQRLAPASIAGYLPEEARTWVRISGVAQVVGGAGLALGIGRRPAATMLAATMVPHVIDTRPGKGRDAGPFVRNLALMGGVLLASLDTQGKPSVAWRAADAKRRVAKEGRKQTKQVKKAAKDLKNQVVGS